MKSEGTDLLLPSFVKSCDLFPYITARNFFFFFFYPCGLDPLAYSNSELMSEIINPTDNC
jgi:hypothetical protein